VKNSSNRQNTKKKREKKFAMRSKVRRADWGLGRLGEVSRPGRCSGEEFRQKARGESEMEEMGAGKGRKVLKTSLMSSVGHVERV